MTETALAMQTTLPCDERRDAPIFRTIENALVSLALAAMMLIPILESLLRRLSPAGIPGSAAIVQHLTLIVSMLGAAIAARDGRLLSLSTTEFLRGGALTIARALSGAVGASVTLFLMLASGWLVQSEREGASMITRGIPVWAVQLILPVGFAAIALRILWRSGETWPARLTSVLLCASLTSAPFVLPLEPSSLVGPALLVLAVGAILGAPIFVILGGAAIILFHGGDVPITAVSVSHYSLVVNATLPAIPLFTLAGYLLAEGGASGRLVAVFDALVGRLRGGAAIVTALTCAFFTSFTGGSGVTILALGGLLMPVLLASRYGQRGSLGLLTGAGSLGLLFPPCLPLILYAVVAGVPLEKMFLGGILPGALLVALTVAWGIRQAPPVDETHRAFDASRAARAMWNAKWELLLPVVALVALFGGFATAVEAAAITALYALIVEAFVYRGFRGPKDVARVSAECGLLVGGVLLILGVALGFTRWLVDAQLPSAVVEWASTSIHSKLVFLLLLNLFLLVAGCLMDIFSAIVVIAPLVVPLGAAFAVDPVHLGIIFLANLELGYLTPPVGMNLFLSSYRFGVPLPQVYRAALPMLLVLLVGVLLITYVPAMTTTLPALAR